MKQANIRCLAFLTLLLPAFAAPNPEGKVPPIEFVQARVWQNMNLAHYVLEGVIRTEKNIHPIIMRTQGREMIYEFQDAPLQIRVMIGSETSIIETRASATEAWQPVPVEKKGKTILDTDICYEDLGLEFMRWPNVKPLGTDSIKTLPAWAFEAVPTSGSHYAKAQYWISSEYAAFLRVDAFNANNEVIKRVEINGVQKIGAAYVLKEMQISNMIPGRELSKSRTYIEIRKGTPVMAVING
jgi:hypothetical protein